MQIGVATHDNSVVPGKYSKLDEAGNKVPSSGCVASYEDSKCEGGKGVHRIAVTMSIACRIQDGIVELVRRRHECCSF